jgi:hypothetical protein
VAGVSHEQLQDRLARYDRGEEVSLSLTLENEQVIKDLGIVSKEKSEMKNREGYEGFVIEARTYELKDGGFTAEFSVEKHDGAGVTETIFYVKETFSTQESAIEAALQAGRHKIDMGFEYREPVVING